MPAARLAPLLLACLVGLATGCRILPEPAPERSEFYTLAMPVPGIRDRGMVIGLGPTSFPGYLDQSAVITRLSQERVIPLERARWAAPLRKQFERSLGLRLMRDLGADVVVFPWWPGERIDAAVELSVVAFETDVDGMARLDAFWTVRGGKGNPRVVTNAIDLREPVGSADAPAGVAALDRALDRLATAIGSDVRQVRR